MSFPIRSSSVALAITMAFSTFASAEAVVCGSTVKEGVLTADLDCSASPYGFAVRLKIGGTLDLAGFTLTGPYNFGVICEGDCTILGGGGTIQGSYRGIELNGRRLSLSDATVKSIGEGITTSSNLRSRRALADISNSEIVGTGHGIFVSKVSLRNSNVEGHEGMAIWAVKWVRAYGTVISHNGRGVYTKRLFAENSVIDENGHADYCTSSPVNCVDVATYRRPVIAGLTCSTSAYFTFHGGFLDASMDWDICSKD